jgi:hypothetical protein
LDPSGLPFMASCIPRLLPSLARATKRSFNVPLGFLKDHESQRYTFTEYFAMNEKVDL